MVEQWTENPRVGGSNPPLGTIFQEFLSQQNQTVAVLPSLFLIVTLIQILSRYYQSVTPKSDQRVTGGDVSIRHIPLKRVAISFTVK